MGYNLFLDDVRVPTDAFSYTRDSEFFTLKWEIVRSYEQFIDHITENFKIGEFPDLIAFDHDLDTEHYKHLIGDIPYSEMTEKTGYHCAQWLTEFCMEHSLKLPKYKIHSMNPSGRYNIHSVLETYKRVIENSKL
jgi:hypothetical protein